MTAISVQGISKAYRIGHKSDASDSLVGACTKALTYPLRNLKELSRLNTENVKDDDGIFWALKDISFDINEGEAIGILGHNGAGKSTLLKVLSKITTPTHGHAKIRGRISSLLEVGTGFHPDLTGRENVYMNAAILGMSKREINRKFDQIVDFSGAENFLDTPTKRYSSGMQVRLAFAVAAHLDPEILIVDEVLAVGDIDFQKKCAERMTKLSNSGQTVLFVSHNMDLIQKMCSRCIVLESGQVTASGDTTEMIQHYLKRPTSNVIEYPPEETRGGSGSYRIQNVLITGDGPPARHQQVEGANGLDIIVEIAPRPTEERRPTSCNIRLHDENGSCVYICDSRSTGTEFSSENETIHMNFSISSPWLKPGCYTVDAELDSRGFVDGIKNAAMIEILPTSPYAFAAPPWVAKQGSVYADFETEIRNLNPQ